MSARTRIAEPGSFLIVGRKDDTDEVVYTVARDIPRNPRLTQLCRRALYESGINDPLCYEFLVMIYLIPSGGGQVVLDQAALRRYVHANYG